MNEFNGWYKYWLSRLETSDQERQVVLEHIRSMPSDSKKRRKQYNAPKGKDAWPGRLYPGTKKPKGKQKTSSGGQKQTSSLDITLSIPDTYGEFGVTIFHPDLGLHGHQIGASTRSEARRKARKYIRDVLGTSITVASSVEELGTETIIKFEREY